MLLQLAEGARSLGLGRDRGRAPSHRVRPPTPPARPGWPRSRSPGGDRRGYLRHLRAWDRRHRRGLLWCNGLRPALATAGHRDRVVHLHQEPIGPLVAANRVARAGCRATVVPSAEHGAPRGPRRGAPQLDLRAASAAGPGVRTRPPRSATSAGSSWTRACTCSVPPSAGCEPRGSTWTWCWPVTRASGRRVTRPWSRRHWHPSHGTRTAPRPGAARAVLRRGRPRCLPVRVAGAVRARGRGGDGVPGAVRGLRRWCADRGRGSGAPVDARLPATRSTWPGWSRPRCTPRLPPEPTTWTQGRRRWEEQFSPTAGVARLATVLADLGLAVKRP